MNETSPLLQGRKRPRGTLRAAVAAVVVVTTILMVMLRVPVMQMNLVAATAPVLPLRIYTHNIRFDNNYNDLHEKKWTKRRHEVVSSIAFHTQPGPANVVCLQEVLHNQLEDILWLLNNRGQHHDWTYYGVGRVDGVQRGEFAPVIFKHSEWRLLENRTYWLSETPSVPSRGWDAALERIVTMVSLELRKDPLVRLNFFNTHFDHRGREARRQLAKLIGRKMEGHNNYPSFLCGDFNTQPSDEPYHVLKHHGFKDSRTLVDRLRKYGHFGTFTGFNRDREENSIIDYIWAPYFAKSETSAGVNGKGENEVASGMSFWTDPDTNDAELSLAGVDEDEKRESYDNDINYYGVELHRSYKIVIRAYGVLANYFEYYMSDHRPVVADFDVTT